MAAKKLMLERKYPDLVLTGTLNLLAGFPEADESNGNVAARKGFPTLAARMTEAPETDCFCFTRNNAKINGHFYPLPCILGLLAIYPPPLAIYPLSCIWRHNTSTQIYMVHMRGCHIGNMTLSAVACLFWSCLGTCGCTGCPRPSVKAPTNGTTGAGHVYFQP